MRKCFQRKSKIIFWKEYRKLRVYFARCANHSLDVEFGRRSFQFATLGSRDICQHSSSKVQSSVHTNRIPLFDKKNISKDYAIRNENITIGHFLLSSCDMSLHGKLVAVASHWLLQLFFLKSNDVLDAVLGTDLGEQRCFKFLIRQFVSLKKTKIICSMTDRKPFVACGFCGVKISPVIGCNTINIPDIF